MDGVSWSHGVGVPSQGPLPVTNEQPGCWLQVVDEVSRLQVVGFPVQVLQVQLCAVHAVCDA